MDRNNPLLLNIVGAVVGTVIGGGLLSMFTKMSYVEIFIVMSILGGILFFLFKTPSAQKQNQAGIQFFTHILRHAWFWPLEFWLRPLTVIDRSQKAKVPEFFAAVIGCGLWGALIGIIHWLTYENYQIIWIVQEKRR